MYYFAAHFCILPETVIKQSPKRTYYVELTTSDHLTISHFFIPLHRRCLNGRCEELKKRQSASKSDWKSPTEYTERTKVDKEAGFKRFVLV